MMLQIATPDKIVIFDFLALGGVGSRRGNLKEPHMAQLTQCANILLKNLFSANDIVKVGWSFSSSDLDMLRSAGGGETDAQMYCYIFHHSKCNCNCNCNRNYNCNCNCNGNADCLC